MTRKKSKILKSFLATASILGLSLTIPVNEIYAVAVSQMVGDVNLNNPNTNFNPPFVNGNTIEVINSGNITVSNSGTYNIGAIRADQEVNAISIGSGSTDLAINLTIGSMSGVVKGLNITRFNNATNINITLNGNAGVGNIPPVNDYSALQQVSFTQMGGGDSANSINLNINAPVTLNSTFNTSASSETINVNDDVIITQPTKASGAGNMNFNIAGDKSLTLSAPNSIQDGTGAGRVRVNFTGANSVLNIDGTNTTIRGAITNGANGTLNVNAGVTTATDSTVTTIQKTNIADNTTFNIDSVNSNMNLLNNGTSIAFKGASSELDLINTGNTDKQFTLYSNLNPSDAEDEYGIVRVEATTNNLTIANNGGPYMIGQDNTHRLKEFEVKGAGNIVIDNTVFTKLLSMNNTGQVTLNQRLDLGAGGNIAFGADGTLVVNSGITGDVDFNDGAGTLVMSSNFGTGSKFSNAANATVQIFSSLISLRDSSAGSIGNIIIGNDNSSATLYANSGISFTGNMIFGSQGGKLWVHNDQVSFSGKIINGIKAELYLENNFTALDPSIGSVNTVNIVDNKTYTIDAKNGNVDLLNNGAKIIFEGADSEVDLVNTGNANKQFTLYSNLNPSDAEDEYGIVRVEATTNNLTIANNGGPYTIGQDNTHRLKEFEVKGVGNVVVDNQVFTKRFNMNSTGQVTLNQVLDLGVDGEVIYNQPGTLNVSGDNPIIGKVNFQNVDDTLKVSIGSNQVFAANIDNINNADNNGSVIISQGGNNIAQSSIINSAIGMTNPIKELIINNANEYSLNIVLNGEVKASKIQVNRTSGSNPNMRMTINNDVTADIEGVSNGSNNFVLTINQGKTVTGAINSINTASTTINLRGSVTGPITNATTINFDGTGDTRLGSTANTTDFIVANAKANVTADGRMIGNLSYNAAGTVAATKGITGDINFKGNDGVFNLGDNSTIDGAVTSTGSVAGSLYFIGDGEVTGGVEAKKVVFNGIDNIEGAANAEIFTVANVNTKADITGKMEGNIEYTAAGALLANGGLTGNVNFNNRGGTFYLGEGAKIIGSVTSTGGVSGTLVFIGDGEATGDIGTDDENKPDIIEIAGDNTKQVTLRGNVLVNDFVFVQGVDSSGKANIESGLVARRVVFNNENADGGTLVINAPSAVNAIVNPNNGMIVLNAHFTISDPSAGDIREIKIADNIKYTIDAKSGNVDLLNNGAKIIFEGAGSELNLINTGNADKQFTLYSNLNPSDVEDEYGIVRVEATTNNLTIANNGGPYTIGQDNTHRLKEFEVKGAGNVVVDNQVFTKRFNMNSTGQVTLNQVLDLGAGGGVVFAADGKLTANNGISGAVTTAGNNTGTLTIGKGDVTGAIGTNGSKLKEVNFNGVSNVTSIDATIVKISNVAANVTATGQISGAVSYTADGKLTANNGISGSVTTATNDTGTLTIGAGNVTGTIGTNGKSLKLVNIGANPITFSSNVFAPVALTDQNSQLTLADGIVVTGSVTTKNNTRGVLSLGVGSSITNGIGANNFSLERVELRAGASSLGGNIYAEAVKLMADTSVLTLEDNAKVYGSVTTKTDTKGVLVLGRNSSVAGIGANGFALERVELRAGASSLGGNIYAGAVKLMVDDSALTLEDNATIHGSVTTKTNEKGILIFSRNGSVTDNIGENGAALEKVIFKGVDTIEGAAYAQTFTIANANANVTVKGLMTGNVNYEADGTLAPEGIIGDIDFKGTNGTFSINDGRAIDGAVLSTGGVGGILNFKGNGTVSGSIGTDAENSPAIINIQGDDTTNVSLANDVFVGGVNFTNGGKLQLNKNLTAKNVDFGAKGGTLEFNGNDKYIFNAVIANGQTGILNVLTKLTATDASVGTLKTINIGNANAGQSFLIAVNNANLALLTSPNSSINFSNANSQLTLTAPIDQTVTFANNLKGGGIVTLNGNGHNLVVDGIKGVTLGSKGNELNTLNILNKVTITNNLDIHNINKLNIQKGAYFTDQSLTSAKIAEINIGEAAGSATYALDAVNGDFDLNPGGMIFKHEDSVLNLKNSSNANDHTINLTGPLDSRHDKFGIIKLTTGDKNLIIANNGNDDNTFGTEGHRLKELDFVSTGNGTINLQAGINVENIVLDIHAITLNKVNANIRFEDDTIYTATGDIVGDIIDFQGKAGVINVTDNIKIDSIITSTGDTSGTLNFEGAGEVTKLITNIEMLKAGNDNVALTAGGDYSIGEIQGNGNNNLTFAPNSRLTTTYINKTGGQAVNLIFTDGGSVRNAVGSNAAVGDIIVKAGAVNFSSTVKSGNIIVSGGAEIEVNDNIIATDIAGENENDGTLKLNNKVPINITGTIGNNNSLGIVEVAGKDVTITGELKAQAINFSNAGQEAILTLQAAGGVTNITTAGNNLHTLAITDFDTGNGAIGAEDHRLKAIELTGNGLVTVNTKNFYSDVTTANNGKGNVKLNIEGGTTYNLGSKNNSLASVQVSENSTIKGDVYSKEINIDAGKNIDFERGNNRNAKNIIIQDVLVDRDLLPRSLQLFTYLTDIKVDNLNFADAAASVHFKDAVLVNAEIDGGGAIKFNENVWLKEEIKNVERLEFGPEKFAILEKNIKAANLVVNKANIVLLDNLGIDADSQFTDSALDLATYELKHTGNVIYNGTLEIITYFDVTAKSGGHILVGNGANVDMSALDSLVIKVKSRSDITKITPDTKHEVILKEAGGNFTPVAQNKVTVDTGGELNRLIRWVRWVSDENGVVLLNNNDNGGGNPENPDPGGGDPENPGDSDNGGGNPGDGEGGVIVPIFDPKPIRDEVTGPIAPGLVEQLIGIGIGNESDAGKVLNDLGSTKNVSETLNRLGGRTDIREVSEGLGEFNIEEIQDILTDISVNMDSVVSSGINARLGEVNNKDESTPTNQAAIAAGDEDNIGTGIWVVPFYGKATQKSRHDGASGYKSKSQGGIIGFDYALSDSVIVGAAYTRADSKLRHQNYKVGDKTKAISDIYSIYGLYNCETSNFFFEAIGSYGRSRIKNYEKCKFFTGDQTAIGKFNNTSYSGELLGGYNYLISNFTAITPMIGARYATFKNNSYKETGTTFQNLSVRKKSYDRFEGIAGLKGVTNFFVRDVRIKPELHGFVSYDFKGKLPNTDARLDGIDEPLTTVKFKPTKLNYNLGGSLSVQYNMMEFGIRYNLSLAKKYIANQGSLRLKVNL